MNLLKVHRYGQNSEKEGVPFLKLLDRFVFNPYRYGQNLEMIARSQNGNRVNFTWLILK